MQTTEIKTTQNVSIEYELATLWERVIALVIDMVIVAGSYLLFSSLLIYAFEIDMRFGNYGIYFSILPFGLFILYNFFFELLSHGQSLGKRALSIQVVRLDGEDPYPGDYFLRSILHFVDTLGSAGILGAVLIGSTPKHQRLGDMAAGTTVIKVKNIDRFTLADILRISTIDEYQPAFPAIRQFNESDMLLIKNAITRYHRYPNEAHRQMLAKLTLELSNQLGVDYPVAREEEFLKTLIRDYIVLTR